MSKIEKLSEFIEVTSVTISQPNHPEFNVNLNQIIKRQNLPLIREILKTLHPQAIGIYLFIKDPL